MSAKYFVDTNVLVYAFDSNEPMKQSIAHQILQKNGNKGELVLSTQVLQEFFVTVTRKLEVPLSIDAAYQVVQKFSIYPLVQIHPTLILNAIHRHQNEAFSFWDSLIVEAALQAECHVLLSEDMQDGRKIDQLLIQNPFKNT